MALLSHHRFEVSCFSSYNIFLFSISITRSSSFPVIHVSVNIKNNVEKDETLLLFFLSKRRGGHSISFQIKPWVAFRLPYLLIELYYIGIPVVRTDSRAGGRSGGRAVGRCTVTWLPTFLGWVVYHIFLPMVLRGTRESFAITGQLFENEPLAKLAAIWVKKAEAGFLRSIS